MENLKTLQEFKEVLKDLTDHELKSFFTTEDTNNLSDDGIIGDVKRFILSGKYDFTMGEKINEIEKIAIKIVIERWLKLV